MTSSPAPGLLATLLGLGGAEELGGPAGAWPLRLSVVGLSKNAGKTVTLNRMIQAAAAEGLSLGLVSTGRDGEEQDAVTELPKPRIWAPEGLWLATAQRALVGGTAVVTEQQETSYSTPFGPLVIGRVARAGEVLLVGPGSAGRIADLLGELEARGAQLCLADGSFDRMAAAAPAVTGRVVMAAGAAYSTDMAETVAQTRHRLDLFDLPAVSPEVEAALAAAPAPVLLYQPNGGLITVPVASGLADPERIADAAAAAPEGSLLVLSGALSDRLLTALIQRRLFQVGLVLHDPTRLLVSRTPWRRWRNQGGQAWVRRPVRVTAVTTNPHSPVGTDYDPELFCEAVAAVANRPVLDLMAGLTRNECGRRSGCRSHCG